MRDRIIDKGAVDHNGGDPLLLGGVERVTDLLGESDLLRSRRMPGSPGRVGPDGCTIFRRNRAVGLVRFGDEPRFVMQVRPHRVDWGGSRLAARLLITRRALA